MLEEIKTFIEFLKSGFHLDEIEKSMYFVKQKEILNQRVKILDQEIAELNKKSGEPEKNNGGFKVSSNTVPLLMAIRQEKNKQETLQKEYNEEVEIFKRACKLDIQDTKIQTYSYEQIAEKPKELEDDQFIYISGNKIYLFKKKSGFSYWDQIFPFWKKLPKYREFWTYSPGSKLKVWSKSSKKMSRIHLFLANRTKKISFRSNKLYFSSSKR